VVPNTGLRVLITNNTLAGRAGTELYARDLARGLLARGHTPIVYSTLLGEVAQDLRLATVPVVDDLDRLGGPPDIIHGQHHLETMTALLRFPGVPAVYFYHGWKDWVETAPIFPRIFRYVAVDHARRDLLLFERGIAEEKIRVLHNFVDLGRFVPRQRLPEKPRRALVFNNDACEENYVGIVRRACDQMNLSLDVVGYGAGNPCTHPEQVLPEYDIVFGTGRSAIESMAVGAAVVLCNKFGVGPMVTALEFSALRALNFGIRGLRSPHGCDALCRQIARYDPADAALVSLRIRAVADGNDAVDEIVALYDEVLLEHRTVSTRSVSEEAQAGAAYLRWVSQRLKVA
jgi:Glycosyltransferase Family 4